MFGVLITMSMTHQTAIIVYRLTDKRIEVFSWKPQIDSVKPVMTWTAIGSGVVVLFLVFIDPAFLIASIGPVGIGIAAALMGMDFEPVLAEVKKTSRLAVRSGTTRVVAGEQGAQRAVVVERRVIRKRVAT